MATIKEIAQQLNISNTTVSRVLNYDETISVSSETREAIFATAEKIGYKKKVIYPKIENVVLLYCVDDTEELENQYYKSIKKEILIQSKRNNIYFDVIEDKDEIAKLKKINGFIAIGLFTRDELNKLYKLSCNGVFIDSSPDEKLFDAVRPNLDSFVTQIVDYFVVKKFKEIGFIGGHDRSIESDKPLMDIREWSFRQSAEYYGVLNEDYIYITDNYSVNDGYVIAKKMVESGKIPQALCVASDTLAVGVLQALNELNIHIPEEVSVFSINDINVAQYVSPPLTTFHIDIPMMCESAIELLRNRVLNKRTITKAIFINGIPVFRKSSL